MSINAGSGDVAVRYADDDGKQKEEANRVEMPPDVANGLILTLLKNVGPSSSTSLSFSNGKASRPEHD